MGIWPHTIDNMLALSLSFERPLHETDEGNGNSEGTQGFVQLPAQG